MWEVFTTYVRFIKVSRFWRGYYIYKSRYQGKLAEIWRCAPILRSQDFPFYSTLVSSRWMLRLSVEYSGMTTER